MESIEIECRSLHREVWSKTFSVHQLLSQGSPFVHSLFCSLEKLGYPVCLDYHSLIPGNPWQEQIYEGIAAAELFLLVVSR